MTRITILCLALFFAGCCKNDERDCRLVGTWVLDAESDELPVWVLNADGTSDDDNWIYSETEGLLFEEPEMASGVTFWRTEDGFFQFGSSQESLINRVGFPYEVNGDSLLLMGERFWRYD